MGKNLFQLLREKTARKPNGAFDRAFWAKFNQEFGERETIRRWHWPRLDLRWLAPAGVSLMLALALWQHGVERTPFVLEIADSREMLQYGPMLKDLDLFLGKGGEESLDYSSLSEEEWNVLLKGT